MSFGAGFGLLRIRSLRAPYRRAGFVFGTEPLVLGPEHFDGGVNGLRTLVTLLSDPVLKVQVGDPETGEFAALTAPEIAQLNDALALAEQAVAEPDGGEQAPAPDPEASVADPAQVAEAAEAALSPAAKGGRKKSLPPAAAAG
jgi:hypothetical protein